MPPETKGTSFREVLSGQVPRGWQESMYYRYWMHRDEAHNTWAHYGVRALHHKLIYFHNDPLDQPGARGPGRPAEWKLYDLETDPLEINNVCGDAAYAWTVTELKAELARLQAAVGDEPHVPRNVGVPVSVGSRASRSSGFVPVR